jgi:hypothetical protein
MSELWHLDPRTRTAALSSSMAEPIADAPPQPTGAIADAVRDQATDAITRAQSLDELKAILEAQQQQINDLQATAAVYYSQLVRLTHAVYALPCPKGMQDHNVKDEDAIASIQACGADGRCTCDVGHALNMPSSIAPPPPPDNG